ncbi:hypothetical protein J2S44_001732 [Catenuloplanes niger]|uniref:Transposase IS110-like N-terminal domain-containing protein n=1 Tax=Catenuloplanes niger TaxID=587534 RepID=A0AAE3ZM85_9ACTN|nr:hypothetical protein [Catenuloplanes niger]
MPPAIPTSGHLRCNRDVPASGDSLSACSRGHRSSLALLPAGTGVATPQPPFRPGPGRTAGHRDYQPLPGIDVGKDGHHAVALNRDGNRPHDAAPANPRSRAAAGLRHTRPPRQSPRRGRPTASIGAPPVAAARRWPAGRLAARFCGQRVVHLPGPVGRLPAGSSASSTCRVCGQRVVYLPGLAMRRIADLHPGAAKTDACDAYVIADAARTMPRTRRRRCRRRSPRRTGSPRRLRRRPRRRSHPAGQPRLRSAHPDPPGAGRRPEQQYRAQGRPGDAGAVRRTGRAAQGRAPQAVDHVKNAPHMGERLVDRIMTALDEQTVVVPGTAAVETVVLRSRRRCRGRDGPVAVETALPRPRRSCRGRGGPAAVETLLLRSRRSCCDWPTARARCCTSAIRSPRWTGCLTHPLPRF